MRSLDILKGCTGFQWDQGNRDKNWQRHGVSNAEAEQVFLNRPLIVAEDSGHAQDEARFYALGCTDGGRRVFVVFTVRGSLIRVISARDSSRKERGIYDHAQEEDA